jgi:hypothetical protein
MLFLFARKQKSLLKSIANLYSSGEAKLIWCSLIQFLDQLSQSTYAAISNLILSEVD